MTTHGVPAVRQRRSRAPGRPAGRSTALVAGAVATLLGLAGCGGSGSDGRDAGPHTPTTITVPAGGSIQAAVDKAQRGDTVVVPAGTYHQAVSISTPGITLRGESRNGVVLDGSGLKSNGVVVLTDDVTVENLTVRNFTQNGVLVTGLTEDGGLGHNSTGYTTLDPKKFPPIQGFAVRYVTATNNALYGIYAFDSNHGVIEQSYASGDADSGIYVGQCADCDTVVRDNVSELNAVGYEQANASDSVIVVHNRFAGNRVGLTLLSDYQEAYVPGKKATVVGNLIADNDAAQTPSQADGGFGIGVGISGSVDNLVQRNRITGNDTAGVAISSTADLPPTGNRLLANVITGNGTDVWYAADRSAPGAGNCLQGNTLRTTKPAGLVAAWRCPAGGSSRAGTALKVVRNPPGISYRAVARPPAQPEMPDSALSLQPGSVTVDLGSVTMPPADLYADRAGYR